MELSQGFEIAKPSRSKATEHRSCCERCLAEDLGSVDPDRSTVDLCGYLPHACACMYFWASHEKSWLSLPVRLFFGDGGRTLCANLALFFGQNWAHTVVSKRRFPWVSWIPNLGETPSYIMYSLNRAQTPGALTQIMLYVKTKKIHTSQSSLDFVTCVHVPSRSYENEHPPHGPRNDKWYNSGGRISSPWSRRTMDESYHLP